MQLRIIRASTWADPLVMSANHFARWHRRRLRPVSPSPDDPAPSVTVFVLSGGGVNGAAQVGMIDELYRRGIRPDAVVGVSAGAINAVTLAADPDEWRVRALRAWTSVAEHGLFQRSSSRTLWAVARRRPSLDSGLLLRSLLRSQLPIERLEECALPVRIGTVALSTGEMHWWSSGSAFDLLLASCAVPGILPPVLLDGQLHVDGGVCSPVPVVAAIELAPTRLVVLDVSLTADDEHVPIVDPTALTVLLRSFEAARRRVAAAELATVSSAIETIHIRAGGPAALVPATPLRISALIEEGRAAARHVLAAYPVIE